MIHKCCGHELACYWSSTPGFVNGSGWVLFHPLHTTNIPPPYFITYPLNVHTNGIFSTSSADSNILVKFTSGNLYKISSIPTTCWRKKKYILQCNWKYSVMWRPLYKKFKHKKTGKVKLLKVTSDEKKKQQGKNTAGNNYRGADKSLARPGRKQATATKF